MCAERARLFVAVDIPSEVKDILAGAVEPWKGKVGRARWVRKENLHLTLKFIGEFGQEGLERLSNEILAVAGKCAPFKACLGGCGAFPSPGKARVLWVGMKKGSEEAAAMASKIDARLERVGVKREGRDFRGHLTIARMKAPADCAAFLKELAGKLDTEESLGFGVDRISLYRSILGPSGPTYIALREYELGGRRG